MKLKKFYNTSKTYNVPGFSVVKAMHQIYKSDILILGFDAKNIESSFFAEVENKLELDIKMLLIDEFTDKIASIIKNNIDSKLILCLSPSATDKYIGIDMFNYLDENFILTIYKYIISLLK